MYLIPLLFFLMMALSVHRCFSSCCWAFYFCYHFCSSSFHSGDGTGSVSVAYFTNSRYDGTMLWNMPQPMCWKSSMVLEYCRNGIQGWFALYGLHIHPSELMAAAREALRRLKNGESHLALHPVAVHRCSWDNFCMPSCFWWSFSSESSLSD